MDVRALDSSAVMLAVTLRCFPTEGYAGSLDGSMPELIRRQCTIALTWLQFDVIRRSGDGAD
jgi:hypothetical protein